MSVRQAPIRVLTPDGTHHWALDRTETDVAEELTLRAGDGREWSATGVDLFRALEALRVRVEPDGIRLCCNGAMRDVYPSRMALSMAGGEVAYRLRRGRRPSTRNLVEVLDEADCAGVVTVAEQRAWFDDWHRTVTGWRWPLYALLSLVRR
jgi:hypothetical protein